MKHIYGLVATGLAVTGSAFAYTAAERRDFAEFAATACNNRDGDFVIRGLVSSVNESTLVLADPTNSRITTTITLPGRAPSAASRARWEPASAKRLINRSASFDRSRTPVVVTMKCEGDGTPLAVAIGYSYVGGFNGAVSF